MVSGPDNTREKVKIILKKLLEEFVLGAKKSGTINLQMDKFFTNTGLDRFDFLKVLETLKERNLVTSFLIRKGSKVRHASDDKQDFDTCGIAVTPDFQKGVEVYIKDISIDSIDTSNFVLKFDTEGNLWHTDKSKFCYSIEKGSARLKFIKYLIENKGYQDTLKLADILNKKSQDVRIEKSKINAMIKKFLDLTDFIENGGNVGGYGINPKYKVLVSK